MVEGGYFKADNRIENSRSGSFLQNCEGPSLCYVISAVFLGNANRLVNTEYGKIERE